MTKCPECNREVSCMEHGIKDVEQLEDPDDRTFFVCYACVDQYHTAFGAIVHWCSDMIGAFGGKEQMEHDGDGREVLPNERIINLDQFPSSA